MLEIVCHTCAIDRLLIDGAAEGEDPHDHQADAQDEPGIAILAEEEHADHGGNGHLPGVDHVDVQDGRQVQPADQGQKAIRLQIPAANIRAYCCQGWPAASPRRALAKLRGPSVNTPMPVMMTITALWLVVPVTQCRTAMPSSEKTIPVAAATTMAAAIARGLARGKADVNGAASRNQRPADHSENQQADCRQIASGDALAQQDAAEDRRGNEEEARVGGTMTARPTISYPHWTPMFPINSVAKPTAMRIANGRPLGKPLRRCQACQSSHGPTATTVTNSLLQTAQVETHLNSLSWRMQALAML